MSTLTKPALVLSITDSLLDALYRYEGRAEIVQGKIVDLGMTGGLPNYAAGEIFVALRYFVRQNGLPGIVTTDGTAFVVSLPHRQSFSPDVAYFVGATPTMRFYQGAPRFAVEVRSENDYGDAMEQQLTDKRADYFATGTLVIWDVDLLSHTATVRKFTVSGGPQTPVAVFGREQSADTLPVCPGFLLPVDDLFAP